MKNSVKTLAERTFEEFRNGSIPLGIATAKLDTKVTNGITGIEMQINESLIDENNLTLKIAAKSLSGVSNFSGFIGITRFSLSLISISAFRILSIRSILANPFGIL